MNALQPWHLIILVLVVVLLFGAKRLPDAARSIGKSMKVFKAETKDLRESGQSSDPAATAAQAAPVTEPDTRQLPQSATTPPVPQAPATPPAPAASVTPPPAAPATPPQANAAGTDDQVEQLQRQLDELKRQQAAQRAQNNAG
ncbi:Sec-independent protein translocase subunit TatA [Saccharomonospora xinjiangensis]|uniref:Sec-independent protein translocase protein TatA n=1 Tax=Saccharomonospora xinjiangensis XJ-54 TaxID=882086 RepID=I0V7W9_9PSEU|nr:Sec-independent protein translocase subunit TatA [Saccharomonospora xinjiangensis]EID56222.1 twin arginine-targeting protein translocase, TatA/E family [Saccharomonospora xinjiangensis XJ-54]